MELSVSKIRTSVQKLWMLRDMCDMSEEDKKTLESLGNIKEFSETDVKRIFKFVSSNLLEEPMTRPIGVAFEPFLLLIITSVMRCNETVDETNFNEYQRKVVAIAKLMQFSSDAKRYATMYFRNKPAPFAHLSFNGSSKPKQKKIENEQDKHLGDLSLIKSCYHLLYSDPIYFRDLWNWSDFIDKCTNDNDSKLTVRQLYCNHIIAMLTNMTTSQLEILNGNVEPETLLEFEHERQLSTLMLPPEPLPCSVPKKEQLVKFVCDNADAVVNIEDVFLPVFNEWNSAFYSSTDGSYDKIVRVDSTKVNLRSIALGIACSKAICLSGPVGCGKTTLIEYLARKTGRICPKEKEIHRQQSTNNSTLPMAEKNCSEGNSIPVAGAKRKSDTNGLDSLENCWDDKINSNGFLRIQLGDQTDSKMLLGQYRCTDVPGEFVWSPGVLTQAVMNGYWLLLEDLDAATQDTYTILSSLLENHFLSVPGFHDCVKIEPGFQLFVTVRTNKSANSSAQKTLFSLLEKYLYTINILPLSRNELCKVVSTNYPKLATVANRIVDVFLTFSSGDHHAADHLRRQESGDKADTTPKYVALPFEEVSCSSMANSGRLVSTRDLIKLCNRSNPTFSVTSSECAYFVFQNAVDVFCSYLAEGREKTKLITSIGAKLGIIQSRCEYYAHEHKPEVLVNSERIKVGRADLFAKTTTADAADAGEGECEEDENESSSQALKRQKISEASEKPLLMPSKTSKSSATFSFTRMASCILERIAVCVTHAEPVLLVGETGVGKTSAVQYLAQRTKHKLTVVNMNNQSDVSDLIGGFKPVDLTYVLSPLRLEFELLFVATFNASKNTNFLLKFATCYNQGNYSVVVKLMLKVVESVFAKSAKGELRQREIRILPRWEGLQQKLLKLNSQLDKSVNISFAFIPGSLVNCIKNGDWVLLDEINLASAETLECLSTILEPDGSVVLLEKGDFMPVKRHPEFRIFACMNPNTDIGKKDLPVGIRNRFTEFFVDELTSDADLSLLIGDYLSSTGIQKKNVYNLVKLYKKLKQLSMLELNDGLGNRPVYSLRTLCRSLRVCAKNLCGSIERNLYESFCMSFLTQLDSASHNVVLQLIKKALLANEKAILNQSIPKPGENYLNFEGYWIQLGERPIQECTNYILTESVKENLRDLARIISIGKLPILLQGPTSAGKTSLIDYVAKRSGNHCLRINNHEHTDLQEYIGTYAADVRGKLSFREGVLVQAMRNGYWIILDELNLASTDILEALNRVLDDNRELFIPETQTLVKAHPNFMLFATQNPPGLYGGRKTLSRAFKNRFIELHFSEIPRAELEIILEKRCLIPASYAKKMVLCMSDLQKNRKTTSKNIFTLRDLFRWGNRYTYADKKLTLNEKYDWNQHLIEEGYLVLSAKVRTQIEHDIIRETLYKNFRKKIDLDALFSVQNTERMCSAVTSDIIESIKAFKQRSDIVWTQNMSRMAILTAKSLQFDEPVLLVGPTGCGKTTVCQILASIHGVKLRILNCHMHTESADFLGGLRPCRQKHNQEQNGEANGDEAKDTSPKLFEWADGPLIYAMQEGSYFMADEISLAEDSVLERLNCILEPERTVLLAEKGGIADDDVADDISQEFIVQAKAGFQFLATMNPGGDFGKKELSPALRNRFTEIWCLPSDSKEDLIQIACNCMIDQKQFAISKERAAKVAEFLVDTVLYMQARVEKFKFSIRDIIAWSNYIAHNDATLSFRESAIFGLETLFLDALEMLPHESFEKIEALKRDITAFAIKRAGEILNLNFTLADIDANRGHEIEMQGHQFGIRPFYIPTNSSTKLMPGNEHFLFDAPTTKKNLFRLLSALSLKKAILLEGPPGVGKTSTVESLARAIGFNIVRINLCEHTDLADFFGTDLPAEDTALVADSETQPQNCVQLGSFVWRDGPLLAALKSDHTWILLDELNLAPQAVLEGLNAILDHRGEVFIPELNKTFVLSKQIRIFACQNPLKQGGGRKGLPQSFLNRFTKVYLRKLTTGDLLHVVHALYADHFERLRGEFVKLLGNTVTHHRNLFDVYRAGQSGVQESEMDSCNGQVDWNFDLLERLVRFSESLDNGIANLEFGYRGGPYEINLRDILRWCDLLVHPQTCFRIRFATNADATSLQVFRVQFERFLLTLYERMKLIYYQRMRSEQDKLYIRNTFARVFQCDADYLNRISEDVSLFWSDDKVYLNDIVLERASVTQSLRTLQSTSEAPMLLAAQREWLKNLIECVHMEKPSLLVGPTDTGKTKLIDVLCKLSNQIRNTDTIDDSVTGSFQQIDLNRHLEELSQEVEGMVFSCLQHIFLHRAASLREACALLSAWSDYKSQQLKSELNENSILSEELVTFRRRVKRLDRVIEHLMECPALPQALATKSNRIQRIRKVLDTLRQHVAHAESLNTGGSFEWVDSKIVKSLKLGQYILLEHVNLCSSAVLDRLNPVFEPNGQLLISEKGVTSSEGAEIVTKAPNFRVFLTIDPKNGELSRAMRNRCIELTLSKDSYSIDDKRMIIHAHGITDIRAINCILETHERIMHLTEINTYTTSHLIQFASLSASYQRIGYEVARAIYVSGMEVYVYAASMDLLDYGLEFYQNKLRGIVLEESNKYAAADAAGLRHDFLSPFILNCSNLNSLSMIELQGGLLRILLAHNEALDSTQLSQILHDFAHVDLQHINRTQLLRFLTYMLYEMCTMQDLDLRHAYVQHQLAAHAELRELSQKFHKIVHTFKGNFASLHGNLPWHIRLMPRLRDYPDHMEAVQNEALRLSSSLIAQLLLCDMPAPRTMPLEQMSALDYSQMLGVRKIIDRVRNAFVEHLHPFLQSLQNLLQATLKVSRLDVDSYCRLLTGYMWINRLLSTAQENLFIHKQVNRDLIDKLILHYKWLVKNLLGVLQEVCLDYRLLNSTFDELFAKIDEHIDSIKQPLNLLRKIYAKQLVQFQPFYHHNQVQFHQLWREANASLSVVPAFGAFTPQLLMKKFSAQQMDAAKRMRGFFNRHSTDVYAYKFKDAQVGSSCGLELPTELKVAIEQFSSDLRDHQSALPELECDLECMAKDMETIREFIHKDTTDEEHDEKPAMVTLNAIELGMQPLQEYYLTKGLNYMLHQAKHSQEGVIADEYCENIMSLSLRTWRLLKLLKSEQFKAFVKVWRPLSNFINAMTDVSEFETLLSYLNGFYKNLNTFHKLTMTALRHQELNNLAARIDCVQVQLAAAEEISSSLAYRGPHLINAIVGLIFQPNGHLKPIPLSELSVWQGSLQQMRQLLWHNSQLIAPSANVILNNYEMVRRDCRRLLLEVEHVQKACAHLESAASFQEFNANFEQLVHSLRSRMMEAHEPHQLQCNHASLLSDYVQYESAQLSAHKGAIELCLLTFVPLIDPVEKMRLKNMYIVEDIDCVHTMITVYDLMKIIMKYKNFGREMCIALEERLLQLRERQVKYTQKVALRPPQCVYRTLVQDIMHFLTTNCEPKALLALIESSQQCWSLLSGGNVSCKSELEACTETVNKIELWIVNSQRFINHTLRKYEDYYQDFLQPLQCSVEQLRYGFEGLKRIVCQLRDGMLHSTLAGTDTFANVNRDGALHALMENIIRYPSVEYLQIFQVQSQCDMAQNRSPIFRLLERLSDSDFTYFTLLQAKMSELRHVMHIAGGVAGQQFAEFDFALNICNQIWQNEEERRRKRQAEESSLYVSKTKCAEEDEKVVELQQIAEVFPTTVDEDFGEFVATESLEKVMKLDPQLQRKDHIAAVVNEETYAFIVRNFIETLQAHTHIYYYRPVSKSEQISQLELLEPFQRRLQVFVKLFNEYRRNCNDWLDERAYNSFCLAVGMQQHLLNELSFGGGQKRSYNFYKDANIPEIMSSVDVMDRIEQHVVEQLELYPEHASLLDIRKVIERIRLLPSTSPVARFNVGFQILRQKVSQWNEVAHKNNHLRNEELEVAEYVQKWTKLELQFWRNCLNQTYEKIEMRAYKYWFFIYNLFQEYLHDHELDSSYTEMKYVEKRFGECEVLDADDVKVRAELSGLEVVRILRQFMEAACYGDFHVRMQLLQSFELYLHHRCGQSTSQCAEEGKMLDMIAALRNLQIYFAQFTPDIDDQQRNIRAPIEKKLKEFVKIESYNKDLSYFSMRNNVARVHRHLNKFLKEYEQQIQQKITSVFQPTDATVKDYICESDKGRDLRYDTKIKYYLADPKSFVASPNLRMEFTSSPQSLSGKLLAKAAKHFMTSRNVVKETVANANYPNLIIALDTLFAEQLEHCLHLRALNVDRSKERPKQVLEAKQILQQKRKGLADLFKILTQLGINFKTGLMELSLTTDFEDYTVPPFCIKHMLLGTFKDRRIQASIAQLSENLDRYYAKSVFKLKLLQNIMLMPLSELGPPNIERIKGFSVDLFLLVQRQRKFLAQTTKEMYDLRQAIQNIRQLDQICVKSLAEEREQLEFVGTAEKCGQLKEVLCRIQFVFEQFIVLINCVPSQQSAEHHVLSSPITLLKTSMHYTNLTKSSEHILQGTRSLLRQMASNAADTPVFLSASTLATYEANYKDLLQQITRIRDSLKGTVAGEYLPLASPLVDLLEYVERIWDSKGSASAMESQADDLERVGNEIENVLHSVLLSLQKLYKKYPKAAMQSQENGEKSPSRHKQNADHGEDNDQSDENDSELLEHHLKQHLHGELVKDWEILNMSSILKKLSNILLMLKHTPPSAIKLKCARNLCTVLPLLEQYNLLGDYYLSQQLGAHKVSAKMLSVMLTVFVEISTKGFCVPPDLMQNEEGEKQKDQKEGEGFGLEDGTGEKDASDKIESEDQLEDAKRPEDRKNEEKKDDEDCKEEKGIEMSEDFEGKAQDIDKPEEDDSGESEEEEDDIHKEMGETAEGAEKLDEQIWGDDDEQPEEEDDQDMKDEQDGKGSKDERDLHNDLDTKDNAANEHDGQQDEEQLDAVDEAPDEKQKKQEQKDIDNMKEDEVNEEQDNPHHNELEEPPEAEEMDLNGLDNVDEGKDEGDDQDMENPFDIDTMKENMPEQAEVDAEEEEDPSKDTENGDEGSDSDDSDSDEGGAVKPDTNDAEEKDNPNNEQEEDEQKGEEENNDEAEAQKREPKDEGETNDEEQLPDEEQYREEKPEAYDQSKDKSSKEENVQSVPEVEEKSSADQAPAEKSEKDVRQEQKLDEQETNEDKEGVGQAENDQNDEGHQGIAETKETVSREEHKREVQSEEKRKQGRTNEERTLGEAEQNKLKQLKTIDQLKEQRDDESKDDNAAEQKDVEADEYQHVREPKQRDKVTLDNATEEQTKQVQHKKDEEQPQDMEEEQETENADELMEENAAEEMPRQEQNLDELSAETYDQRSEKPSKSEKTNERAEAQQEEVEVEGEVVPTMMVPRSTDTTAHCISEILLDKETLGQELSAAETIELRKMYQNQVTANRGSLAQHEDFELWQIISNRMNQNARELCEQLRLILEPTKCTRLKGDYRTGRRINMKKIIPYIASQFRKDKIWLRRTKPAQRDYKITIAIDDSKSMHHNNSKTLTLEAISLVSQALTLLESGRLSIVSFGEAPQIIMNHTDQFDGPKLVKALNFSQDKTKIAELLDFIRTVNVEEGSLGATNGLFENLLLILSDGRNIYSEGKVKVRNAIKMARLQRIFLVYIIIDNPDNKNSILDIQSMEVLPDKRINIKAYLDDFPFPYYVIVRDLNQLPLVLSEAMRQWFELVNSEQ